MRTHRDDPVLRSVAYHECLLCQAEMPMPTAGYLRRHYRAFHLVSKEAAIVDLIVTAEKAAAVDQEDRAQVKGWDPRVLLGKKKAKLWPKGGHT